MDSPIVHHTLVSVSLRERYIRTIYQKKATIFECSIRAFLYIVILYKYWVIINIISFVLRNNVATISQVSHIRLHYTKVTALNPLNHI